MDAGESRPLSRSPQHPAPHDAQVWTRGRRGSLSGPPILSGRGGTPRTCVSEPCPPPHSPTLTKYISIPWGLQPVTKQLATSVSVCLSVPHPEQQGLRLLHEHLCCGRGCGEALLPGDTHTPSAPPPLPLSPRCFPLPPSCCLPSPSALTASPAPARSAPTSRVAARAGDSSNFSN